MTAQEIADLVRWSTRDTAALADEIEPLIAAALAEARAERDALLAELEAARAVVDQARRGFGTEADIERAYAFDPVALCAAIRRYDATTTTTTTAPPSS